MQVEADRQALARTLLLEIEPDEIEFFGEYVKAAEHQGRGGHLGPEWGIPEAATMGPVAVAVGFFLFELFKSWTADVPKKIVEGFLVDRGKDRLKAWLGTPKKEEISSIVTVEGRAEIMAVLGRLIAESKLSPHEAEQLTKKVASYLFENDARGK